MPPAARPPAPASPAPFWGRPLWLCAACWAILEAALLALRPGYPFTLPSLLDSWYYAAFQWDLPAQMREFGETYYASRVSLFLPGAALHAVLPPVLAAIAYKLLASGASVAAWAFVAHRAAGLRAALWATLAGTLAPWFIVARHNDYMDLAIVAYGALTLAATVGAPTSPRAWLWRWGAGAAFASMLVANLSTAATVGLALVLFHFLQVPETWAQRFRSGLQVATGAALALAFYSCVSALAGGPGWVLGTQLKMLVSFGTASSNPWAPGGWSWLPVATWLVLPVGTLLWALLRWPHRATLAPETRRTFVALTAALALSLGSAFAQEWRGLGVLFHWFYAVFHTALAVPLLALLAANRPSPRGVRLDLLAGAVTLGLLLTGVATRALIAAPPALHFPVAAGGAACALALFGVATLVPWLNRGPALLGPALAVLLLVCSAPIDFNDPGRLAQRREHYQLAHDAFRVVTREFGPDAYRFWLDPAALAIGTEVASTKCYGYRLLTLQPFPSLGNGELGRRTLVLPTTPGRSAELDRLARESFPGFAFSAPRVLPVPGAGGLGLELLTFRVLEAVPDPELAGARVLPVFTLRMEPGRSYAATFNRAIYQPGAAAGLVDGPDYPRFTRTDERDHVASQFAPLPAGGSLDGVLVLDLPRGSAGTCVLQTDTYQNVRVISLAPGGRQLVRVRLPADARAVRIYFQADSALAIALPRAAALYVLPKS